MSEIERPGEKVPGAKKLREESVEGNKIRKKSARDKKTKEKSARGKKTREESVGDRKTKGRNAGIYLIVSFCFSYCCYYYLL